MELASVKLEDGWKSVLADQFGQPYMAELKQFILSRYREGHTIYPKADRYFEALNLTPFDQVKAVILGQDPYHNPGQAHGLCFSVPPGIQPPPSLVNIYKELHDDLGYEIPHHGYLRSWAEQGVLLLNSTLTVEEGKAGSHQNHGWETFTDAVIERLGQKKSGLVFILWGAYAQKKGSMIDDKKHLVLKSPHPSPLSAYRGFFGSKPFSQTNDYLSRSGQSPVNWQLPE